MILSLLSFQSRTTAAIFIFPPSPHGGGVWMPPMTQRAGLSGQFGAGRIFWCTDVLSGWAWTSSSYHSTYKPELVRGSSTWPRLVVLYVLTGSNSFFWWVAINVLSPDTCEGQRSTAAATGRCTRITLLCSIQSKSKVKDIVRRQIYNNSFLFIYLFFGSTLFISVVICCDRCSKPTL